MNGNDIKNSVKVSVVGSVGIPARYGGWETLVEYLTKYSSERVSYTVYCSSRRYNNRELKYNNAYLRYINLEPNGISSIFYDVMSMWDARKTSDVQLVLGVSGCVFLPIIKVFSKSKFIVNIDGLEWRRDKWGFFAKKFLKLSEIFAVRFADMIITDNEALDQHVRANYNMKSEVISYGGDHVFKVPITSNDFKLFPFLKDKYFFKVARIEPENNILMVLSAFAEMPDKPLVIVGNWDNSEYGINLKKQFSEYKNIYLYDPIYDLDQLNLLRSNSLAYVHGHSAGGTNPSLVEAMSLGLCILAFDVNFNRHTTMDHALYFDNVDSVKGIVMGLTEDKILIVGKSMRDIAVEHYLWSKISRAYEDVFATVLRC